MGMGVSEVYEDVREEFRHDLQSRGILVDDAESQSAGSAALHTPAMAAASSATEAQWQYRWSPDGETFGPFPTAHMSAWFQQGFFTAPIWARQVRGNEALGSFEEVDPAKAAALFR